MVCPWGEHCRKVDYNDAYMYIVMHLQVREHFLPPLLDAILGDYYRNVPQAREPEVLSTVTAIVDKLEVRCTHRDTNGEKGL